MIAAVNFSAGPAALPRPALERARAELLDYEHTGFSIMEHSHRSATYDVVHRRALALVRELLDVPDTHSVFMVQGGASGMFATVPLNFLLPGRSADYVVTGIWSKKALAEAQIIGTARSAGTGEVDGQWARIPSPAELDLSSDAAYAHITTNNTIAGTQWAAHPHTDAPLVADASSDLFSRPFDVGQFAMIYAGAQKNLGPSGVTLGVVRTSWLDEAATSIPRILRFKPHVEAGSLLHTPPTFAVYLVKNVLEWLRAEGGVDAMQSRNATKAALLYDAIDASDGWYSSPVQRDARSQMNVVFRCPTAELDAAFVEASTKAGLIGLKGHRTVGGLRASLYNAVPVEGVERLVELMSDFRRAHC